MIDWKLWNRIQQEMSPWHWGLVIVAVALSIWLIFWLRSYFREDDDDADETLEMLTQFRELHQEGGLSDDEFRLIKSRLAHTAQVARVIRGPKQSQSSVVPISRNSIDAKHEVSNHSPDSHATEENVAKSERMTDEETD